MREVHAAERVWAEVFVAVDWGEALATILQREATYEETARRGDNWYLARNSAGTIASLSRRSGAAVAVGRLG